MPNDPVFKQNEWRGSLADEIEKSIGNMMRISADGDDYTPHSRRLAQLIISNRETIIAALRASIAREPENLKEECLKAAASAYYKRPSSWPGDYPRNWRHPPFWEDTRKPTPDEAAWHDNGVRDTWVAIRELLERGDADAL